MARQFGLKIRRLNCTKTHVDLLLHYNRNRLNTLTRTPHRPQLPRLSSVSCTGCFCQGRVGSRAAPPTNGRVGKESRVRTVDFDRPSRNQYTSNFGNKSTRPNWGGYKSETVDTRQSKSELLASSTLSSSFLSFRFRNSGGRCRILSIHASPSTPPRRCRCTVCLTVPSVCQRFWAD